MMNERVDSVMTTDMITTYATQSFDEVARLIHENRIHHLPVVDERYHLVGLISQNDLFKHWISGDDTSHLQAKDLMTTGLAVLEADAKIGTASEIFMEHLFHAIPIVEEGSRKLLGIISTHDLLKYSYQKEYPNE